MRRVYTRVMGKYDMHMQADVVYTRIIDSESLSNSRQLKRVYAQLLIFRSFPVPFYRLDKISARIVCPSTLFDLGYKYHLLAVPDPPPTGPPPNPACTSLALSPFPSGPFPGKSTPNPSKP